MGEYGKAIEIYDELIDHGESRAYSLKAYCLAQQKKLNKAIDVCDQGIKEHPDDGEIYCTKYAVLAKQEKYTQGLKAVSYTHLIAYPVCCATGRNIRKIRRSGNDLLWSVR